MNHRMVLAALAGVLLQAGGLRAQKSDNSGLMVGLHAVPMGLDGVGTEAFQEQGIGLGLTLGYGFNERIAVYTTLDAGAVEYDPDNPAARGRDYESVTVDFGARMSFGGEHTRMRPYIDAAITGVATSDEVEGGTLITSGGGVTVGGGLQYFYRRGWALNAGLQLTSGAFTEVDDGERRQEFAKGHAFMHTRIHLGVIWHR